VRRLLSYVAAVALAVASIECAFRALEADVAASSSRIATKEALLTKQGPVQILFLGTSRFWDAIEPRRFADAFPGARAFNLAASGAKLPTLEEVAARCARRPGLRVAFIELSGPQLDREAPSPPAPSALEALAARVSKLIEHRAALRGESLLRLPGLTLFATRLDGSEVTFADQLASWLGYSSPEKPGDTIRVSEAPATFTVRIPAGNVPERAAEAPRGRAAVADRSRAAGVDPLFALPPILLCEREPDEAAVVAASLGSRFAVWDYRAALPPQAFRDCSHLNRAGRAAFSEALARYSLQALRETIGRPPQAHADLGSP